MHCESRLYSRQAERLNYGPSTREPPAAAAARLGGLLALGLVRDQPVTNLQHFLRQYFPSIRIGLTILSHLKMNRAVFLDRDGTIIEEREYLHRVEQVAIFPGAPEALKTLQDAGFKLFIVSNQSGVGRGYFSLADVDAVNQHLARQFARAGVRFEKIYVAPEAPDAPSRGRKPSPQFLLDARDEFDLDLAQSYMIGDKLIDLECGWNAGVTKCLLVRTGYGQEVERDAGPRLARAAVVNNLKSAADWILNRPKPDA